MPEWQIIRNQTTTITADEGLFDVEIGDTANPFGNYAIAFIEDTEGSSFEDYTRGTRIDFEYKAPNLPTEPDTFTNRFTGFVVERRELDRGGSDSLEIECYSFDQFLRRSYVTNDQSGETIENALNDIITTDTAINWNASKVNVVENNTVKRPYSDERVDNAIKSLATLSANENWGVDSSLDFFFEPRETSEASRDIDNSQWFNFDIPETGKETINQVTVWYDNGDKSVTVSDGSEQLDLQDQVGAASPIKFETEVARFTISDLDEARAVGEQVLNDRQSTLTGTVTTYGLMSSKPGDVIDITITPRGINDEFVIADLTYTWGDDKTVITIVEKKEGETTRIRRISDTLKRVELRGTSGNPTGGQDDTDQDPVEQNVVVNANCRALLNIYGDVNGTTYQTGAVTNYARNRIRDAWGEAEPIEVTQVAVGNDGSNAQKTDSALGNELERLSTSSNTPASDRVEFGNDSFTTTDIREVGLFDTTGSLVVRATVPDTSFSSPVAAGIGIDVADDSDIGRGVVVNTGQTATRDIINHDATGNVGQMGFGDDNTTPTETDTALGNELVNINLDESLLDFVDSNEEWTAVTDYAATDPIAIENSELTLSQTLFWFEASDWTSKDGTTILDGDRFSFGRSLQFDTAGSYTTYQFTPDHTIPAANFALAIRWQTANTNSTGDTPEFTISLDGNELGTWNVANDTVSWSQNILGDNTNANEVNAPAFDITPETHEIRFFCDTNGANALQLDVIAPYDDRFTYNFDNTTTGTLDSATLSGPELYPQQQVVDLVQYDATSPIESATVEQSWNDTTNGQFISLSNDGTNYTQTTNSQTASATFGSPARTLFVRMGISRFADGNTTRSPTDGNSAQAIDDMERSGDINPVSAVDTGIAEVKAVVPPGDIAGQLVRELGQKDSSGNLLTHSTFAETLVEGSDRLIGLEQIGWVNGNILNETDGFAPGSSVIEVIDDWDDGDNVVKAANWSGWGSNMGTTTSAISGSYSGLMSASNDELTLASATRDSPATITEATVYMSTDTDSMDANDDAFIYNLVSSGNGSISQMNFTDGRILVNGTDIGGYSANTVYEVVFENIDYSAETYTGAVYQSGSLVGESTNESFMTSVSNADVMRFQVDVAPTGSFSGTIETKMDNASITIS